MNCAAVRDLLPEHAVGVVPDHDDDLEIELHLAWCAACRKEARDLERAAGAMAFALAPAQPGADLEDRVVASVVDAALRPMPVTRRRGRRAGVVLLAAAVALAGLGAGVGLARHGGRIDPSQQAQQQKDELDRFRQLIENAAYVDPATEASLGTLDPTGHRKGSGSALTIVSPSVNDQVVVIVNGLPDRGLPYAVTVSDGRGHSILVAWILSLDTGGGATVAQVLGRDLTGYVRVVVRDERGRSVLAGALGAEAPLASPAP